MCNPRRLLHIHIHIHIQTHRQEQWQKIPPHNGWWSTLRCSFWDESAIHSIMPLPSSGFGVHYKAFEDAIADDAKAYWMIKWSCNFWIRIHFSGAAASARMETRVGAQLIGMRWLLVATTWLPIHSWLPQSSSGSTTPFLAPRSKSGSLMLVVALLQKLIRRSNFNALYIAIYWSKRSRCTDQEANRSVRRSLIQISNILYHFLPICA